jgi:membrane associated rhomboid family serine protease
MELNHLFLFAAVVSSLFVFGQSFRGHNARVRVAAALVLIISALAWLLARSIAGWIAAGAWFALLFLPAWRRHRFRAAHDPFYRARRPIITLSPCVLVILIINVAAFAAEIVLGGSTDPFILDRLGWLDTDYVIYGHQYWRMLTALFLHFGALHLVVNMFALLILGAPLERQIGRVFFAGCYIFSGLGSSITVVLLAKSRAANAVQLVGASGCIMGIVGAWAGILLRNPHLPFARQRLRNIAMIVALQVAFDLVTPRVSLSAHLGGLATGFLVGLVLPTRRKSPSPYSSSSGRGGRVSAR